MSQQNASDPVVVRSAQIDGETYVSLCDLLIFVDQCADNLKRTSIDERPMNAAMAVLRNLKTTIHKWEIQ